MRIEQTSENENTSLTLQSSSLPVQALIELCNLAPRCNVNYLDSCVLRSRVFSAYVGRRFFIAQTHVVLLHFLE